MRKFTLIILSCLCLAHVSGQVKPKLRGEAVLPWLSVNQEKYFPRDTIYFRAWLFHETQQPAKGRYILQLSLLDARSCRVAGVHFIVKDGVGFNQLAIPDSLREGAFLLVAHAPWLPDDLAFRKPIQVVTKNELNWISDSDDLVSPTPLPDKAINVKLTPSKTELVNREKVSFQISVSDEAGLPLRGDFSVAAVQQRLQGEPFTSATATPLSVLAKWKLKDTKASQKSNTYDQLRISGKVVDAASGKSVPDSTRIFFYLQRNTLGYESLVMDGRFELDFLFDFWGIDDVFCLAEYKGRTLKNLRIEIDPFQHPALLAPATVATDRQDPYPTFAFKRNLINSSYSYFRSASKIKEAHNPNADFEDEIMGADVEVKVDDYIVFPTVKDLVREVVPSLTVRGTAPRLSLRVVMSEAAFAATEDPLYVIDGFMTRSSDFFLSLKPADIVSIKVVKNVQKLSRMGYLGKNGIIIVNTRKPNAAAVMASAIYFASEGLSKAIPFSSLSHSASSPRTPDFRSTLYWNPGIKTDDNGNAAFSFFISDDVEPIQVKVEGFTLDGRYFSTVETLQVSSSLTQK